VPRYATERGAIKAMRRAGFQTLEAMTQSSGFERIAPAACLPADLLGFRTESAAFGMAVGLALDGGRCIAFIDHERLAGTRAVIVSNHKAAYCAWRVPV
jgi:hypothetical protein